MVVPIINNYMEAATTSSSNHHARLLDLVNNQCRSMSHLKQIHAHTLRTTSTAHPHTLFLHTRILHFASLHDPHYAFRFFQTYNIHNPNSFSWNTVIRAFSRSTNQKQQAILLYLEMLCHQGDVIITPDKHTFPFVLKACAYLFAMSEGRQLHAHIVKLGLASDVYINNSLIHFYGSCGSLEDARDVFLEMPERSVVSWNVMIDTLVQLNQFDEALMCFREMQQSFEPDSFAIQSILRACAGLGALSLGMWAHAYVLKRCNPQVADDVLVNNCLLDMYCKCGSLETARLVFERMAKRDVTSWNTMILGFAMHGDAVEALEYFTRMTDEGRLMPTSITFSGVLSACRHSGLVDEGRNYFTIMTADYGIEPVLEHYGCLVDLLARAGLIAEALDVVSKMTIKPDAVIWRSILDACSKRSGGIEVSEEMAKKIMESEEGSNFSGVYVLLSRVYAVARKWDEVGSVRKLMTDKGVAKEPGCSTIEIDGVAHEFFAGVFWYFSSFYLLIVKYCKWAWDIKRILAVTPYLFIAVPHASFFINLSIKTVGKNIIAADFSRIKAWETRRHKMLHSILISHVFEPLHEDYFPCFIVYSSLHTILFIILSIMSSTVGVIRFFQLII